MPKREAYALLDQHVRVVLAGVTDGVTAMATMSALIHHAFGFLWTGFYRVVEPNRLLRVGPYQGTLGCLEIEFGRGVCGIAAARNEPIVVPDVDAFAGHIACDSRARSEIVVPVHDATGTLQAILDVDSERLQTFDDIDLAGLSRIVAWFAAARSAPPRSLA